MSTKSALRRAALPRRRALTPAAVAQRSAQLSEQLFAHFPVAAWHWLHVFLPLARQQEPDTWLIIRRIWAEALPVQLAAPVVQADGISLKHYELTSNTPLVANRWGIPEPGADPATEVAPAQPDAVLVPLLACDRQGQRVGYGGGFYDRFLAQCRPDAVFIGLNILDDKPVPALADVLPTDVPLHACLTPGGVWKF
ncbi:5-formyltetrahydrofolate cyclo-ligase [Hymenobacter sp. UV11]|uniref:5-formyltetrahydrofolate cyclo-ligase n=1 Tax=Hymenobacter sp. UV11 TaxID=1849735 RepID=UPI001060A77B|nr:5-formyltetrahydrofolate cyclo-ligase [Hymenobacter sp. UV11]TDN40080.1 5-formyltetrahydrofolate cyclo-ligase [Hymenobacter sp. UV11]TFZ64003.1 5-formyltetrahydrofolate cyclo-ligase [Hymenobacter sp. UV11]